MAIPPKTKKLVIRLLKKYLWVPPLKKKKSKR